MEWVETTAKTIEAAREAALDQLGVAADEAEFETIEEPRPGLFGRVRGEARLRARVRPAQVRPKQERRRKGRGGAAKDTPAATDDAATDAPAGTDSDSDVVAESAASSTNGPKTKARSPKRRAASTSSTKTSTKSQEHKMSNDTPETTVTPEEVGAAAVTFMEGLTTAFGAEGTTSLEIDGTELQVTVSGSELGLLVGPGGRTLNAIQDLARVAAQRRLGDHETRLRIDVAGYRARREVALSSFARDVAEQVRASGTPRSLEPMSSADRKVVHDVLNEEPGVASRSVGEDPDRRIIVDPVDDVADDADAANDAVETSNDDD
jgi:spoIIIJ-associated protein